jgi:hypothetical protein
MALKFTLVSTTIPVTLDGGNGKPQDYEIREMTALQRDSYMDALSERVIIDKDGKAAGIKKFDGMQADLVARCLFQDGKLVTREAIQAWPASTVAGLFDECQKLNRLNVVEKADAVKNG